MHSSRRIVREVSTQHKQSRQTTKQLYQQQSDHEIRKNSNKIPKSKSKRKSPFLIDIPPPTLALIDSMGDKDYSIFQISNYTTQYSTRQYTWDNASYSKFKRGSPDFDIVDAVVNLSGKAKIDETTPRTTPWL